MHETIVVQTNDGDCPVHIFVPAGEGEWPAAIFMMDGLGIRPTLFEMAQRLADGGYVVALPDLFYRAGTYAPFDPVKVLASPDAMSVIGPLMATLDNAKGAADVGAVLDYLATRSDVSGAGAGITGYCMGGAIALTAAARYPDRIKAAASFHGGNLATGSDLSPHLLAPQMKGRIYIGAAVDDPYYPPEMEALLLRTFDDAGVDYLSETYEGALHGWTMPDFPVFNEAAAERHWIALFALFKSALR